MYAILVATALFAADAPVDKPFWTFDPNTLMLSGADDFRVRLRPVGDMHGVVIERMADAPSPVAGGRAFLNLEHYLEKGRWGEYLPRKLDQTAVLNRRRLGILFPRPQEWPVTSQLEYTWTDPRAIDARLSFAFDGKLAQFEVYFTSYFDGAYERYVRVGKEWIRPEISDREQLLIPRDDAIAARYEDGRWGFLKGRTRLSEARFDLPIITSVNKDSGWVVAQMIEPGVCTHIAPNWFAAGHNYIIGGWDVKDGDSRTARIRMLMGKDLTFEAVEKAYKAFADECRNSSESGEIPN